MKIQNSKIYNQIYSILNHKGYDTPLIRQNKKVENLINIMAANCEITNYYLEKTERILSAQKSDNNKAQ